VKGHTEEWLVLCGQAAVEQDPAKMHKLARRITELLAAKQRRLQGKGRIFQIAYDRTLLIIRAELLKNRGYEVASVVGNDEAKHVLAKGEKYRLFIVGHAAPRKQRESMVRWLKANFPEVKVLAFNPPNNGSLTEADFNFVHNGPEEWLAAVGSVSG
jgi:hypothetical protein